MKILLTINKRLETDLEITKSRYDHLPFMFQDAVDESLSKIDSATKKMEVLHDEAVFFGYWTELVDQTFKQAESERLELASNCRRLAKQAEEDNKTLTNRLEVEEKRLEQVMNQVSATDDQLQRKNIQSKPSAADEEVYMTTLLILIPRLPTTEGRHRDFYRFMEQTPQHFITQKLRYQSHLLHFCHPHSYRGKNS